MKEPEPRPKLVRDPEVQAMDRLSRILDGLKGPAQHRVVQWLKMRYLEPTTEPEDYNNQPDPNF